MRKNDQDHSWRDNLARLREKPKPWPPHRYYNHGSNDVISSFHSPHFETSVPNLPKVRAALRKNTTPPNRRTVPLTTQHSDFETYLDPTVPSGDRFEKYMKEMRYRKLQQRLFEERLHNEVVAKGGGWKVLPKITGDKSPEPPSRNSHMVYMPSITHGQWSPQDSI